MDLIDAKLLAINLMKVYGVWESGWRFDFHRRKNQYGTCNYAKRMIFLSEPLTKLETRENVRDTILHEIAHALTPGDGHGWKWQEMARKLGAKPSATFAGAEVEPKWVMVFGTKVVKKYYKKPNQTTFDKLPHLYMVGKPESKGQLKLVPYESYKRALRNIEDIKKGSGSGVK